MAKCILLLLPLLLLLFYYNEQNIQLTSGCDSMYNVHGMVNIHLILCIVDFRVSQIEFLCKPYSVLNIIQVCRVQNILMVRNVIITCLSS